MPAPWGRKCRRWPGESIGSATSFGEPRCFELGTVPRGAELHAKTRVHLGQRTFAFLYGWLPRIGSGHRGDAHKPAGCMRQPPASPCRTCRGPAMALPRADSGSPRLPRPLSAWPWMRPINFVNCRTRGLDVTSVVSVGQGGRSTRARARIGMRGALPWTSSRCWSLPPSASGSSSA